MTKIAFISKKEDAGCAAALSFLQANFSEVTPFLSGAAWGGRMPAGLREWRGDYIVSYLGRWILPREVLSNASKGAINFHPASPDYPGLGSVNFALYEEAKTFGATCHIMEPKVDSGRIIAVKRFPVFPSDTVESLLSRTYTHQLALFYEVLSLLALGRDLPGTTEQWTREPFTRSDFNRLFIVTRDMPDNEIARRIRALEYKNWGPYLELCGRRFALEL